MFPPALYAIPAVATAPTVSRTTINARRSMIPPFVSGDRRHRVQSGDDGVGDLDDLVHREVGSGGVCTNGLGARCSEDADGPEAPEQFVEDVAAEPADVLGSSLRLSDRACKGSP